MTDKPVYASVTVTENYGYLDYSVVGVRPVKIRRVPEFEATINVKWEGKDMPLSIRRIIETGLLG